MSDFFCYLSLVSLTNLQKKKSTLNLRLLEKLRKLHLDNVCLVKFKLTNQSWCQGSPSFILPLCVEYNKLPFKTEIKNNDVEVTSEARFRRAFSFKYRKNSIKF